jgi:hypothetical protein
MIRLTLPAAWARTNSADDEWIVTRPNFLTLMAGSADPSDPSHFTIPYRVNGVEDTIDGWLQGDGTLLRPRRGGPISYGSGTRTWELGVPASQPATDQSAEKPG